MCERIKERELKMKGTKDLLNVVCALADALIAAKKDDGQIDYKDLPKLLPVIKPVIEAWQSFDKIPDEFKNIDKHDFVTLAGEAWDVKDKIILVYETLKNPVVKAELCGCGCEYSL